MIGLTRLAGRALHTQTQLEMVVVVAVAVAVAVAVVVVVVGSKERRDASTCLR